MTKTFFKGTGYTLLSSLLSLMFIFFSVLFLKNTIMMVIAGLCTLFILCGLHINYAYFEAKKHRSSDKPKKTVFKKNIPFVMGFGASLPLFLMWIMLMMSKAGVLPDIFGVYKLLNQHFLLITSFTVNGTQVSDITALSAVLLLIASFIPFIPIIVTYYITYNEIDIRKKLFYEK